MDGFCQNLTKEVTQATTRNLPKPSHQAHDFTHFHLNLKLLLLLFPGGRAGCKILPPEDRWPRQIVEGRHTHTLTSLISWSLFLGWKKHVCLLLGVFQLWWPGVPEGSSGHPDTGPGQRGGETQEERGGLCVTFLVKQIRTTALKGSHTFKY